MHLRADQISPLEMFKIGIGPSSSHTVGPMVAALEYHKKILDDQEIQKDSSPQNKYKLTIELFGSLSATGKGHCTDGAVCAGLLGLHPSVAKPEEIWAVMPNLVNIKSFIIGAIKIDFDPEKDILWKDFQIDNNFLPHPNTIRFRLYRNNEIAKELLVASVGGGFVELIDSHTGKRFSNQSKEMHTNLPYPYNSATEFVQQCINNKKSAWEIVIANEAAKGLNEKTLRAKLAEILNTMMNSIEAGLSAEGILPGGLNVQRRAKKLYQQMTNGKSPHWAKNDLQPSVYAIAVNEENAAGGRVVTAPTNGSSGIIPSVWRTLKENHQLNEETLQNGLLVASVIGALVKVHASISGAEVGCQGEVGTSCAMAAAGATAMLGGNISQIEQAAEMGIEHHLGMTCDPIKGLVQIPCIERNAMGAVKALNACVLALASDGSHMISLDRVLEVMKQTGLDMNQKYKETATGGLALG
jgi:L-serine dehydratase